MKKHIILSLVVAAGLSSCEKDLELYSDPTCRLNFYYGIDAVSDFKPELARSTYSFVYGDPNLMQDTVWVEVESMGFVADTDRAITIEQVDSAGVENAVAGKHYIAFNDPQLASRYVMPAGKARTRLPIVMLRDASLKDMTVVLKYRIKPNENFVNGYDAYTERVLEFTDQLSEPSKWTYSYPYFVYYTITFADYFGDYGLVKHQFLISETGEKWDDEYIDKLMTGDANYLDYICRKMARRLREVNAERQAQGLDVLREADGTPVDIYDPYA
ncbi:MAG: DUF4843 domain-containing protein [Prevotella sp.]